jgi:ABC-type sugar transport system permease subunit
MSRFLNTKPNRKPLSTRTRRLLGGRLGQKGTLYLFLLPSLLLLLVFSYYPKIDVVFKSLYRWQPPAVQEYVGIKNFIDVFADPLFWSSFGLIGILLCANVLKMIPSVLAAIAVHRVVGDRLRYYYQITFVIPMIVPSIVWVLLWKGFYDPDFGIINKLLNSTGMMSVLRFLDGTSGDPGLMPSIASKMQAIMQVTVDPVFGSVWGFLLAGAMVLALRRIEPEDPKAALPIHLLLFLLVLVAPAVGVLAVIGWIPAIVLGLVLSIILLNLLSRRIGTAWVIWPFLILGGILIYGIQGQLGRLPIVFLMTSLLVLAISSRFNFWTSDKILQRTGHGLILVGALMVAFGLIWTEPTEQFLEGTPSWLGSEHLVIPAIILMGFPWVGTVSVLIFLSGLQQISQDVYEAAELDGVSPLGKILHIELPLILTQVRISLILLTISTMTAYEQFLILLGPSGGVANKGLVPGLYMFKMAFEERAFGYACALGMVLFAMILVLTIVYNRYVKIDK